MTVGPVLPEISLVLDNDIFTHWRSGQEYVKREISSYIARLKKPPALTSITVFEALYGFEHGAQKSGEISERTKQNRAHTEQLVAACDILPFDRNAAAIAAHIAARLSRADYNKHLKDVFIAATALAHGYGLVTRNRKDFEVIARDLPIDYPVLRLAAWR